MQKTIGSRIWFLCAVLSIAVLFPVYGLAQSDVVRALHCYESSSGDLQYDDRGEGLQEVYERAQ